MALGKVPKDVDAIAKHAEGGHFVRPLGNGSSFVDRDTDVAAAVALGEKQDGNGNKMFIEDGSLIAPGAAANAAGSAGAVGALPTPSRCSPDSARSEVEDEARGSDGEPAPKKQKSAASKALQPAAQQSMDLNSLNESSAKVGEFPVSMAMGKIVVYSYTSKKDSSMVKTQKFDLRKSTPSCTTKVGCGYCSHQNEQVQ